MTFKIIAFFLWVGMLLICAGCNSQTIPTSTIPPSPTRTAQPLTSLRPTQTPRPIDTRPPTLPPVLPTVTYTAIPLTLAPQVEPSANIIRVGASADGREIIAYRMGSGQQIIMLVGGIHGGWEANTITLMQELIDHFGVNSSEVLPPFSLLIIPTMNPDGAQIRNDLDGRFNGNGVDLNRNWTCGWSAEAVWREGAVNPGTSPMSEPETQAVAALIQSTRPQAVLFYHSAANGVFAGNCAQRVDEEWRSGRLEAIYAEAAGYSYGEAFAAYPVTGTAPSWVDGLGIPSVDVELSSSRESQFERNLRGVIAVQCWLLGTGASQYDTCDL